MKKITKAMIAERAKELMAEERRRSPNAKLNRFRYLELAEYQLWHELLKDTD